MLALLALIFIATVRAEPLRLGDEEDPTPLSGRMEYLLDPGRCLSLPEVIARGQDGAFAPAPGATPNFGAIRDRIWLRLALQSAATATRP